MNQISIYSMTGGQGCPLYHFFLWILRHGLAVQEMCNINKFMGRGGKKENDGRGGFNYVILEELL
jgi:hypothetical protein